MKQCTKCKQTKPLGGFFKNKRNKLNGKNQGRMCKCKECSQKAYRIIYEQKKKNGICICCGKAVDTNLTYCSRCKKARNLSRKQGDRRLKKEIIERYGGQCACCKEKEIAFLTIDHIQGNGNKHRTEIKKCGGTNFYHWLKKNDWPEGFQILCFNCNCGRQVNNGVCPHKEK